MRYYVGQVRGCFHRECPFHRFFQPGQSEDYCSLMASKLPDRAGKDFPDQCLLSTTRPVVVEQVGNLLVDLVASEVDGLSHELWAAAQLLPGDGIEDGVARVASVLLERKLSKWTLVSSSEKT